MAAAGERMIYTSARRCRGPPDMGDEISSSEGTRPPARCDSLIAASGPLRTIVPVADHRDVIGDLLHFVQQVR